MTLLLSPWSPNKLTKTPPQSHLYGRKNPESGWWNKEVKVAIKWGRDYERCMDTYKKEKERIEGVYIINSREMSDLKEDVSGKQFWKEVCKLRGGNNVKKCSGIKNDVQGTWEKYFEDLYEEDTEEWAIFNMCGFDIARMSNYFTVTYAKEFSWKEINHIQGRQNGYQLSSSLDIVRLQCLKWNYCGKGWILYIWGGKGVNQKTVIM